MKYNQEFERLSGAFRNGEINLLQLANRVEKIIDKITDVGLRDRLFQEWKVLEEFAALKESGLSFDEHSAQGKIARALCTIEQLSLQ